MRADVTESRAVDDALPPPAQPATPKSSPWSNSARLFGYDIFVSFGLGAPPRGTQSYASDLARRLRELDFSVFYSEDAMPPGGGLSRGLIQALHRSKTLVVVANYELLVDPRWVRKEVETFRARWPSRPVVPINVAGALQDGRVETIAEEWLAFRDRKWLAETQAAVDSGIVSDAVLKQIAMAPRYVKSNVKWRWVVGLVTATLAALVAAFFWQARLATERATHATALRLAAEARSTLAGLRPEGDLSAVWDLLAAHTLSANPSILGDLQVASELHQKSLKLTSIDVPFTTAIAVSRDLKKFIVGTRDGDVQIWDAHAGKPLHKPERLHSGAVFSVAFDEDGSHSLSAASDGTLVIRDAAGARVQSERTPGTAAPINSAVFGRDGSHVISGSGDGSVRIWDARTGRLVKNLLDLGRPVHQVAIAPRGQILATSANFDLRTWDTSSGGPIGDPVDTSQVQVFAFSLDGALLAVGGRDGKIRILVIATREFGEPLVGHTGMILALAFSSDGRYLVSGGRTAFETTPGGRRVFSDRQDKTFFVWDVSAGQPIASALDRHSKTVKKVAFSPGGDQILAVSGDAVHRVEAPKAGVRDPALEPSAKWAHGRAISPDQKSILATVSGRDLQIFDVPSGKRIGETLSVDINAAVASAFSFDGKYLVTGGSDGLLRLWDARTSLQIGGAIKAHTGSVSAIAFDRQGRRFVSGDWDNALSLWEIEAAPHLVSQSARTGVVRARKVWTKVSEDGPVRSISFSPDGSRLVVGMRGNGLRFLSPATGEPASALKLGHSTESIRVSQEVGLLVFDRSGHRLVSASSDHSLRLWNVSSASPMSGSIKGHEGTVQSVSFTRDGAYFASAGGGEIRIWDSASGRLVGTPIARGLQELAAVSFGKDDRRLTLVTYEDKGETREWPVLGGWAERLCAIAGNMPEDIWAVRVGREFKYVRQCRG